MKKREREKKISKNERRERGKKRKREKKEREVKRMKRSEEPKFPGFVGLPLWFNPGVPPPPVQLVLPIITPPPGFARTPGFRCHRWLQPMAGTVPGLTGAAPPGFETTVELQRKVMELEKKTYEWLCEKERELREREVRVRESEKKERMGERVGAASK
jgi:hypothetical protein